LAATNLEPAALGKPRFTANLLQARWVLLAVAVVLAILWMAGAASALGAAVVFLVLTAAVGLALPESAGRGASIIPAIAPVDAGPGVLYGRFVEALPDPSLLVDRRGVVRHLNRRAVQDFSLAVGDALTFRMRVPDVLAAFDRVAKGGAPERIEFAGRVPAERWYAAWMARLADGQGSGDLILLILDDLTERRRTERVRVDFVANASHELRTPLASLAGFIETLQGPARNDPEARDRFLAIMHDQAGRMSRLVNDLLSLSRIEMKAHLRPADRVDLVTVASHVVDALTPLATELGVAIETDFPQGPLEVTGDRDELIQVVENLVENACKYGQSGERVVVTVGLADGAPRLVVRDFGPGIAEEHVPRLTERFYRVDVEASRRHRGTGLGLAIVKHILARHQARLAVASRPGEGAAFTVTFPVLQPPAAGPAGGDQARK
jgi:two-component system phosphate regulon sensor histidine kinase PhoR